MNKVSKKTTKLTLVDIFLLLMIFVPFILGIILKILTSPAESGINVTGAQVYFTIPMPIMDLPITESQIISLIVIVSTLGLCLFLTRNLKVRNIGKRQIVAEFIVEKATGLVRNNMGEHFVGMSPYIASIMALSAMSSLSCLLGLYAPTGDVNIVGGWALLSFILITYYKLKGGLGNYLKGYLEPIPVFAPMNVISELATPISMALRHYGNIMSGTVIDILIMSGLSGLSSMLLGAFGQTFPLLGIGLPAVLDLYFDVFSGLLQAYIFAMLTMMYISNGFPKELYERRKAKRAERKALHAA